MYVNLTPVNSPTYGTKTKQQAGDTTTYPSGPSVCSPRSKAYQQPRWRRDCERCWRDARRNLLRTFKNKSDLPSEIQVYQNPILVSLRFEYQAKFPDDSPFVLRKEIFSSYS